MRKPGTFHSEGVRPVVRDLETVFRELTARYGQGEETIDMDAPQDAGDGAGSGDEVAS